MVKLFLYALVSAWIIGMILAPILIPLLRWLRFGQRIRRDGPKDHLKKSGTPTMGGIIFIINLLVTAIFWAKMSPTLLLAIVITSLYGVLGLADDLIKTVKKRSLGLRAWQKLSGEVFIAFALIFSVSILLERGVGLSLPFSGYIWEAGGFYYLIAFVLVAGATNGVNLTDGLDGLAAGICFFAYLGYGLIALSCVENPPFAQVDYVALTVFAGVMAGICLAFLFFNHYPAKVFMGDTGSLFLGGGIAVLALLTGTELLLIVLGGVFVLETLSVMIQVVGFKLTGKRVFRMAPLHHHFELVGWRERKVVYVFWGAGFLFVIAALLIYFVA